MDDWIIDRIRRQREREEGQRLPLYAPLPVPPPRRQDDRPPPEAEPDRGVWIIQL